jgi:hypothetical protein
VTCVIELNFRPVGEIAAKQAYSFVSLTKKRPQRSAVISIDGHRRPRLCRTPSITHRFRRTKITAQNVIIQTAPLYTPRAISGA